MVLAVAPGAEVNCDAKALMPVPQSTAMRAIRLLLQTLDELGLLAGDRFTSLLQ